MTSRVADVMATAPAALPMPPQLTSDITCQHERTVQLMRNYPIRPDRHPTALGGFMLWARRGHTQEVEERRDIPDPTKTEQEIQTELARLCLVHRDSASHGGRIHIRKAGWHAPRCAALRRV
ncbi:hypothetical protein LA080_012910 [Diaporthe eres]|nr:hypothetical protein LA080_012910 [Diaporthe eres]